MLVLLGIALIVAVVALPYVVPQTMPAPATWLKASSISLYSKEEIHAQTLQACFAIGVPGAFDGGGMGGWPDWTEPLQNQLQNAMCANWPHICPPSNGGFPSTPIQYW